MLCLLAAGALLAGLAAAQPRPVNVGGYPFPPFVESDRQGEWSGVTLELLALLNRSQQDYRFIFQPTSASRRYHDFDNDRFDLVFFESPHWGWNEHAVQSLVGPTLGGEVFVAAARQGRSQAYFADRSGKRIALYSGYHYAFAGYNADKSYLRREHNAILTFSQESSLQMVLRDRVELAVIPAAFLQRYLSEHPDYRDKLLVAAEPDQRYRYLLVKRASSEPDLAYLSDLVARLEDTGELQKLLERHGLLASIGSQ
ncbi:substrate-binding periplasmic protein [Halopseudomonas sp.]|uniref:substrate-binding periplasmic protein n=1 Tax=Halopseudomonas sp. TaxID=2901191 RepID=UPI0030024CF4